MFDILDRSQKRGYKSRKDLESMTREEIYALAKKRGYKVKKDKKRNMIIEFMMYQ